jgi:hypothetical protein
VGFEPTRNSADDLKSPPLTARAQYFVNNLQFSLLKYEINIGLINSLTLFKITKFKVKQRFIHCEYFLKAKSRSVLITLRYLSYKTFTQNPYFYLKPT